MSSSRTSARRSGAHGGGVDGGEGGDRGGGGGGGGDGGPLVRVATARNQAEAEMLQGLLLESGIPSMLKRSGGFDVPEFLSAGPHDVYVRSEVAQTARDLLGEATPGGAGTERGELEEQRRLARGEAAAVSPGRLAFWIAVVAIAAVVLILIVYRTG